MKAKRLVMGGITLLLVLILCFTTLGSAQGAIGFTVEPQDQTITNSESLILEWEVSNAGSYRIEMIANNATSSVVDQGFANLTISYQILNATVGTYEFVAEVDIDDTTVISSVIITVVEDPESSDSGDEPLNGVAVLLSLALIPILLRRSN